MICNVANNHSNERPSNHAASIFIGNEVGQGYKVDAHCKNCYFIEEFNSILKLGIERAGQTDENRIEYALQYI